MGKSSGTMGDNLPTVNLGTRRTAIAIAAGNYHTCVQLDNSSFKCWGANDQGKLGYGHALTMGAPPPHTIDL